MSSIILLILRNLMNKKPRTPLLTILVCLLWLSTHCFCDDTIPGRVDKGPDSLSASEREMLSRKWQEFLRQKGYVDEKRPGSVLTSRSEKKLDQDFSRLLKQHGPDPRLFEKAKQEDADKVRTEQKTPSARPDNTGKDYPGRIQKKKGMEPSDAPQDRLTPDILEELLRSSAERDKPSWFEKYASGQHSSEIIMDLTQFGYDFFSLSAIDKVFLSLNNTPPSKKYIVASGDTFSIKIWGQLEAEFDAAVKKDGKLLLEKAGPVDIGGLYLADAKKRIKEAYSRILNKFRIHISLSSMRPVRIFVVGEAVKPGMISIPPYSSFITAIMASGGPKKNGSLRHITLKRENKILAEIDLYDFLLNGKYPSDVQVISGDIICIPVIGKQVAVAGNVKRPAIYELHSEKTVADVVKLAGGITAIGHPYHIALERIVDGKHKKVLDTSLKGPNKELTVRDGDIIKVYQAVTEDAHMVKLTGHVYREEQFEWKKGMQAGDLIRKRDLIKPEPLWNYALIERITPHSLEKVLVPFNLKKAVEGKTDIALQPKDTVTIFSRETFSEKTTVMIEGAVHKPGEFEFRRGMRVADLIRLAGGITHPEITNTAELTHIKLSDNGNVTTRAEINIDQALKNNPSHNRPLHREDYLFIKTPTDAERKFITVNITGEVTYPGKYAVVRGERLADLITRAGGFTKDAYLYGSEFSRESIREQQKKNLERFIYKEEERLLELSSRLSATSTFSQDEIQSLQAVIMQKKNVLEQMKAFEITGRIVINLDTPERLRHTENNILLENRDALHVPKKIATVAILGNVYSPNTLVYSSRKNLNDYLDRAGGLTREGDRSRTYIVRANGATERAARTGFLHWGSRKQRIMPGDTIVVPAKPVRIGGMRLVKDLSSILFNLATTTGVFYNLFDDD